MAWISSKRSQRRGKCWSERLAALVVPQAQQDLVLAHLVLPQVEDRLTVEDEATVSERRAEMLRLGVPRRNQPRLP